MAAPTTTRTRRSTAPTSAGAHAGRVFGSAVAAYLPDRQQPLWRRALFIVLSTLALCIILPTPTVVSDPSHGFIGFDAFPERPSQFQSTAQAVWLVEETPAHELYSNGLRIDTSLATRNTQRFYQVLDRDADYKPSAEWFSEPAGIVFHASESPQAPFEAEQNHALQRIGRALLHHVVANRSYNYVIDRFGRVFRIVEESDAAHHAGNSVWASGRAVYLNLNNSFLGVSFEAAGEAPLTAAQVLSGRLLTQLLRSKYRIPIENCVTHAQVSVNPSNLRIGYHTDGARGFPFAGLGLANNYDLPVAAVAEFGFTWDEAFRQALGGRAWKGLTLAEDLLARRASSAGMDLERYRAARQERYRSLYAAYKETLTLDEAAR